MRRSIILSVVLLLPACGKPREPTPPRSPIQVTFQQQIAPLLQSRCVSCHGEKQLAGNYDLSSYVGLLGPGSDETWNAIAGDPNSLLLTKLDAAKDPQHWGYLLPQPAELGPGEDAQKRRQDDRSMLQRWVVANGTAEQNLAYFDVQVHPPAWLYAPARDKESFHGGLLRRRGWDLALCSGCHGADFRGGSAGRSCLTCHVGGPEGCSTCHGNGKRASEPDNAPPPDLSWKFGRSSSGVGAHRVHLTETSSHAAAPCSACHLVPATARAPGHLDKPDFKAEVRFGGVAAQGATGGYDPSALTCAGSYCHGAPLADPFAKHVDPKWTAEVKLGCDSCHGMPGKGLGGPECQLCHQQSVAACTPGQKDCLTTGARGLDGKTVGVRFISPSLHIDGKSPTGASNAATPCSGCHGTGELGTPAPGVRGETLVSQPAVGLHERHLKGSAEVSDGVDCGDCHLVPRNTTDKGHVDSDLPAEVIFGPVARGEAYSPGVNTKPAYDRAAGNGCKNTFCHDLDGATLTVWSWVQPITTTCTSCHGTPPATLRKGGTHPAATPTNCNTCHPSAYVGGKLDPAKHVNGRVEL